MSGLPKGTADGQLLGWDNAISAWVLTPVVNTLAMWSSLAGSAIGVDGQMQTFNLNGANPGGFLVQTKPSIGISAAGVAPVIMPACTLVKASLSYARAAVDQGTTGGDMKARFGLYDSAYSGRTEVELMDFAVTDAGINNSLAGDNFTRGITLAMSTAIDEGALLGVEFDSLNANNNQISSMRGMFVYLEFEL